MGFVRLTQIDGKLPNLALMRLSAWHKARGDEVYFTRSVHRDIFEPDYDHVYGSTIFTFSRDRTERFMKQFPKAIVGGTGYTNPVTVESIVGEDIEYDYSPYDNEHLKEHRRFKGSIGFTQRGCRLKCKFCVVPMKEGKNNSVSSIWDIWRGDPYPRHLHLLDNDFFGQEQWRERLAEIQQGGFKVCLNQGINVRLIDDEAAEALASIDYRDDSFQKKRLYTAWDNLKDEKIFFRGVERLERAGIPPKHLMVYMLIGFDPKETEETRLYRFQRMRDLGILPYPMVYNNKDPELKRFQRWVVGRYYQVSEWSEYNTKFKNPPEGQLSFEGIP